MKKKKYNFNIKKFTDFFWGELDEFSKYFIGMMLIVATLLALIHILSFFGFTFLSNILISQTEWISIKFSVPIVKDKLFSTDATDILVLFTILIILFGWGINKLIKLKSTRKNKK